MRYWSLLSAKLAGVAVILYSVWRGATLALPSPKPFLYLNQPFGHDLAWTLAARLSGGRS
jgi:hypothetical protein